MFLFNVKFMVNVEDARLTKEKLLQGQWHSILQNLMHIYKSYRDKLQYNFQILKELDIYRLKKIDIVSSI